MTFVALLDHDDELPPDALAEVVRHINAHPDVDVLYSDEDKLDLLGARCDPYFKPDWSPDHFLTCMYTCHFMVMRRSVLSEVGGFRAGYEGAQDYDLLLRIMERTSKMRTSRGCSITGARSPESTASAGQAKPWALDAGRVALEDYVRRTTSTPKYCRAERRGCIASGGRSAAGRWCRLSSRRPGGCGR